MVTVQAEKVFSGLHCVQIVVTDAVLKLSFTIWTS